MYPLVGPCGDRTSPPEPAQGCALFGVSQWPACALFSRTSPELNRVSLTALERPYEGGVEGKSVA